MRELWEEVKMRDPRVAPEKGDTFRKWGMDWTVIDVTKDSVRIRPALKIDNCPISRAGFLRWAQDAEVINHAIPR